MSDDQSEQFRELLVKCAVRPFFLYRVGMLKFCFISAPQSAEDEKSRSQIAKVDVTRVSDPGSRSSERGTD